jgi:SAM-dependent methyltransferase
MTAATAVAEIVSPYQFKPGPYSSHGLLINEFPQNGKGLRALDLGCAAGYLSSILADRGFAVTGVDRPGTPHPATVEFSGADLDNGLPTLTGQFDYIVCADLLEHLRMPLELLKECRNFMAPGATLVCSLPNSGHAWFRWNVLRGRFPQDERGLFDKTHLHFYTWDGWVELFRRAGFTIESFRCSGVPIGFAFSKWQGTLAVRGMERLSFDSARIWKKMFAYQFIVRAKAEVQNELEETQSSSCHAGLQCR